MTTPIVKRETRKGEQTRERIVERAVQQASLDGLDGLTIGALATELGLSKSGLIAHFGSKEGLQRAVLESAVDRFSHAVIVPALESPRGEPRLRVMFERWLAWIDAPEQAGGCVLMAASPELDDRPGPLRDFLVQTQQQLVNTLARAAAIAVEAGHFRPDLDTVQFAFEMQALAQGYSHWRRLLQEPRAEGRAREAFERILLSARA